MFNEFVFQSDVVDPARLIPFDTKYATKVNGKYRYFQRDELCQFAVGRETEDFSFILLGIENYAYTNYKAPVTSMTYDALDYQRQATMIYEEHRSKGVWMSEAEYMSRYPKGAYLKPVITLIWNLQPMEWDGPKTLKEMMKPGLVDRFGRYFNDYGATVIDPYHIPEEVLNHLSNNLRAVMGYSKYSRDPDELYEFVSRQEIMHNLDPVTADLINLTTKSGLDLSKYQGEDGGVSMCLAIEQMRNETKQAKAETKQEKAKRKKADAKIKSLVRLLKEMGKTESEIETYLNSQGLSLVGV